MDSNQRHVTTNQLENFVDSLLKARLRMLQPMILPYYLESFAKAGFSKKQLPVWPEDESTQADMQPHVTALIAQLIDTACQSPDGARDSVQASTPFEIAASTVVVCLPLYRTLALDSSQKIIRILTILPGTGPHISCSLEVAALQGPEPYDALSYVWGPPLPTETITVNGTMVEIGRNLHAALMVLRLPDVSRRLWADAICINQQDDHEKSWQVAIMADIYRHAETVRVFVGEEGDAAPLFRFLNRDILHDQEEDVAKQAGRCGIPIIDLLRAYVDFSLRSWFSRIWVYQEFALACKSPVWQCGSFSATNGQLKRNLQMLYDRCVEFQVPFFGDIDYNFAGDLGFQDFISKLNVVILIVFLPSLLSLYRNLPRREYLQRRRISTDPRDLIFGLREFFEPAFQYVFQPDYTLDRNTLFLRLSAWLLVIDQWGGVFEAYPHRLSPDLPSWARDFTPLPPSGAGDSDHADDLFMLCAIYNRVLAVDGVDLDEVAHVFPVDEQDSYELVGKLWHLDWLFRRMGASATQHKSVLSPLDNLDSLYSWATTRTAGQPPGVIPEVVVLTRLSQSIIEPYLHDAYQQYEQIEAPSDDDLQLMPKSEAIAYLDSVGTKRSRLVQRIVELQDLLTFIIKSTIEDENLADENIAAASLYDYESFVRQIKTFADGSSSSNMDSSAPSPVDGEDEKPVYGPGTITYTKTLAFLHENCSPDAARFLLDVSQALHTGKLGDEDIWSLVAPDFQQQLDRERKRIDVWQRKAVSSLPSCSTENDAPSPSPNTTAEKNEKLTLTTTNFIGNCIQKRDRLGQLGKGAAEVTKFANSREEIARALGEIHITPFAHRVFFITKGGVPGVGTIGVRDIQPGDKLIWLNGMRHPLVVRKATGNVPPIQGTSDDEKQDYYEIIGTAMVRGIMKKSLRSLLGDNMPPTRKFMFV
ncbi:Heterokaryon incompatibility protein (HET) domain containing protein [Rhypophila decipiens]